MVAYNVSLICKFSGRLLCQMSIMSIYLGPFVGESPKHQGVLSLYTTQGSVGVHAETTEVVH